MYAFGYNDSLESEVMSASPVRLIELLYRGALDAVRAARLYLLSGDIAERSRKITKAQAIITELAVVLDHSADPALSHQLAELYDYMQRQLIAGNAQQADAPLAEVEALLTPLAEGWAKCAVEQEMPVPVMSIPMGEAYAACECFG